MRRCVCLLSSRTSSFWKDKSWYSSLPSKELRVSESVISNEYVPLIYQQAVIIIISSQYLSRVHLNTCHVGCSPADASDYSGILPSLGFDFGSEMFCFRLFISNDSITEGEESFTLEIALDPANGNSVNAFIPPEMSRAVINIRETCYNGEIRLRGGYDENQGRVEICYDGVYGTVCGDTAWIEGMNAQVVCRQLGLSIGRTLISLHLLCDNNSMLSVNVR